jgi:glycosyltransferase involved in cell wall biosynthesis
MHTIPDRHLRSKAIKDESAPLVSVITPVFNAEKYIAECIESVIAQTYENWEYVILNNCSSDNSLAIAQKYADQDRRIRVFTNQQFLDLMPNWNHAMQKVPAYSKYCKVLHSDDWLFPECLERMVVVAEAHPSVGIVSSYRLDENQVNLDGLPYSSTFVSGSQICRQTLLGELYVFGSPTSILIRSDLIRKNTPFYNEDNPHADKEICFTLLQESDFGFVHQVLTYTRRHNESVTAKNEKLFTHNIAKIKILKKYGSIYLSNEEYQKKLKAMIDFLYIFLAKNMLKARNKNLWNYYKLELKSLGHPINNFKLIRKIFLEILNLKNTIKIIKNYHIESI